MGSQGMNSLSVVLFNNSSLSGQRKCHEWCSVQSAAAGRGWLPSKSYMSLCQHVLLPVKRAYVVRRTLELLKSAVSHTPILFIIVVGFGANSFCCRQYKMNGRSL